MEMNISCKTQDTKQKKSPSVVKPSCECCDVNSEKEQLQVNFLIREQIFHIEHKK